MASINRMVNHVFETDVLVVGGGSAGLFAAIKARAQNVKVMLVDKAFIGRSGCSPFAAGVINICSPEDNTREWFEEIITRGEYLNDQEWVQVQLKEAYGLCQEIQGWGKQYGMTVLHEDEQGKWVRRKARGNIKTISNLINALPMMDTLRRKAIETGVSLMERIMVTHLLVQNGRVVGALGLGTQTAELYLFKSRAIILAAGGCGFKAFFIGHHNLTGEAQYMAYRVGAEIRNVDQAMSNTTAREFDVHGLSMMVGAGGRFLNAKGEEFMLKYDPAVGSRARLSRLVVGMAMEVEAGRSPVYLDLTRVTPGDQKILRQIVPEGFRAFDKAGVDPFSRPVEWMPAYEGTLVHGGGVHIDTRCASTVPGLYAVGDTTCTPEHGTWSITGLNLAFCFISGARAGDYASRDIPDFKPGWRKGDLLEQVEQAVDELLSPICRKQGILPEKITQELLAALVPYKYCYLRTEETIKEALEKIERVRDQMVPEVFARDPHGLVKAFESKSMTSIAEMINRSLLFRKESRGFLYRRDYPMTDNINWLKWVVVKKGVDGMLVEARGFPTAHMEPPREVYLLLPRT
jgi:succinate dehydrogenase/fumarate reductase flavoprotein subunit